MCLDEVIARLCPKKAESPDGQAVPRAIDEFPSMNALKRQQIERHDWAIEQFRALRQECIQSEVGQHSTMQWGIAVAIGSIAAGLAMSSLTESIARALAPEPPQVREVRLCDEGELRRRYDQAAT